MNWDEVKRMRDALQEEEQKKKDEYRTELYLESRSRKAHFTKKEEKKKIPLSFFAVFAAGGILGAVLMFAFLSIFTPEMGSSDEEVQQGDNLVSFESDKEEKSDNTLAEGNSEEDNSFSAPAYGMTIRDKKQKRPQIKTSEKNDISLPESAANLPPELRAEIYGEDAVAAEFSRSKSNKSKKKRRKR